MKIWKDNIEELFVKTHYTYRNKHDDIELNRLLNYWCFFEEKEMIMREITKESLEVILYSKYYWCSRYKEKYIKIYGTDAGIEQQQYRILEELDQRLENGIDWSVIQDLEEKRYGRKTGNRKG